MSRPHSNRVEDAEVHGHVVQVGKVDGDLVVGAGIGQAPTLIPLYEADPVRLGVHRPIRLGDDTSMPAYVTRDIDPELHSLVTRASETGGFVLLVGGSSVGKTRSLFEALRAVVPNWSLSHPSGEQRMTRLERVVVWLDELQQYLNGRDGLTASDVRDLLGRRVIIVATLWPHYYDAYVRTTETVEDDRYAFERELLKLATVVRLGTDFTAAEMERARTAAVDDARLQHALEAKDFGVAQVLAAAPQIVHRWENANGYARAVLTAAVDCVLLGAQQPVPAEVLRAAAPGYCTPTERAGAPADWFEKALAYVAQPLLGSAALLMPVGKEMGTIDGYRVADYLLQHAAPERRTLVPPAALWTACVAHLVSETDVARIGRAALARQRFGLALPLVERAAKTGLPIALHDLAELHHKMGNAEDARQIADQLTVSSEPDADLHRLLLAGWNFEEIFDLAEQGNEYAIGHLIEYGNAELAIALLLEFHDTDDDWACAKLAERYEEIDELDKAIDLLKALVARGHDDSVWSLAEYLKQQGRFDELYELTDEGYFVAAICLAQLLEERGDEEWALDVLREFAGQGSGEVDWVLADLLRKRGELAELVELAESGVEQAVGEAAELLVERGEPDRALELLRRAAARPEAVYAKHRLAESLAELGRMDEIEAMADAGSESAARVLAKVMLTNGKVDDAIRYSEGALGSDIDELVSALVDDGRPDRAVELLRSKCGSGDRYYTRRLAELLRKLGLVDELRARIDLGDEDAAWSLGELLIQQGRADEAERLRRFGMTPEGEIASAPPSRS
ncbi:tetratricopeptide repeat protein [Amycolatopsis japonica]|uniref:tetratricopeptide repeat protein n=1 Tax=Amycolatopsis japonica TaxID=208439 RepID=UPI00366D33C6